LASDEQRSGGTALLKKVSSGINLYHVLQDALKRLRKMDRPEQRREITAPPCFIAVGQAAFIPILCPIWDKFGILGYKRLMADVSGG
jgi:hypothetical protein